MGEVQILAANSDMNIAILANGFVLLDPIGSDGAAGNDAMNAECPQGGGCNIRKNFVES